jgi:hypothetical protein
MPTDRLVEVDRPLLDRDEHGERDDRLREGRESKEAPRLRLACGPLFADALGPDDRRRDGRDAGGVHPRIHHLERHGGIVCAV